MCTVKTEDLDFIEDIPKLKGTISNQYNDQPKSIPLAEPRKEQIKYIKALGMLLLHLAAAYGVYILFASAKWKTVVFDVCLFYLGGIGITAGAHRLWSHRSYKAKLPLQILLIIFYSVAVQYDTIIDWVKDHRSHHKYSDTDADPHNPRRGLFYAHMGWLLVKRSDLVKEKLKSIDISDVTSNPVLKFQKKYAYYLLGAGTFVLPTLIPMLCWNETLNNAWHLNLLRYVLTINAALLINSAAHKYGNKPYDQKILASDNGVIHLLTGGEGYHNFHHAFPYDYRSAELGQKFDLNVVTLFINACAKLGLAYDLRTASPDIVQKKRTIQETKNASSIYATPVIDWKFQTTHCNSSDVLARDLLQCMAYEGGLISFRNDKEKLQKSI